MTDAKNIHIPVPPELAALVREIVPVDAIIPTINKERWAFCILWKSHKDRARLTAMLKRRGLRLKHEGDGGKDSFSWVCQYPNGHDVWSCCCDCAGCYQHDAKGYGFWYVARIKKKE